MTRDPKAPLLQNIPIRTDLGRKIREAFQNRSVPMEGDYSSIELRILRDMQAKGIKWRPR